jgi:serine/threonine-protein kinase
MVSEAGQTPRPSRVAAWTSRVRGLLTSPLDAELESAFQDDFAQANCRRLLALAPLVLVGHAIHVALFRTTAESRASLTLEAVRQHDGVALVHAVTFVVTLALAVGVLRYGRTRAARFLGPAVALTYFLHGAAIAGVDQLSIMGANGVAPFMSYCLFFAVVVTLTPRSAVLLYAAAAVGFWATLRVMQPSPGVRLALMPNGISITLVSLALSIVFHSARRREFSQRKTIERQQQALATLNADLERRVEAQVSEIVKRAEEVDRLNAQLRAAVRTRSNELSVALAQLAQRREGDGRLHPGTVLGERFEVAEFLGQGGMGVVYAGIDRTTGERVAIKVVQASSARQLDSLHRFLREARATATVSHPAIVRALHVDVTDDGMLFQVHDLVSGVTLQRHVDDRLAWEPGLAARAGAALCDALAAAHDVGVVHRDVKPSNIMLTLADPGLKLLDFGVAKLYEDAREGDSTGRTASGVILGTPAYMSPEQLEGLHEVTAAADVYATGVILFQLLTARLPFDDRTRQSIAFSQLFIAPPDVRTIAGQVPESLAALVSRSLDKDPLARPQARELADALRGIADALDAPPLTEAARARAARTTPGHSHVAETMVSGKRPSAGT